MKNETIINPNKFSKSSKVIRVDRELVERLEELSKISRTPIKDIADRALVFALQHATTKRVDCYDISFELERG